MSIMATAQQEFLPSFYDDGITTINPAAFRMEQLFNKYTLFAGATYRHQWVGFDYAPRTIQVQMDGWLPDSDYKFWEAFGNTRAGLYLMMDDNDPLKLYNAYGQFAHQIKLAGDSDEPLTFLSLGLNLGLASYHFNPKNLDPIDNVTGQPYDAWISASKTNQGFFIGVSVPHILGAKLTLSEVEQLQFDRERHYYAMVGGQFGAYEFTRFKPMLVMGYLPNAPFYLSGNLEIQIPLVHIPYFSGVINSGSNSAVRFGFGYISHLGEVSKLGNTYKATVAWMLDNR